MNHYLTYLLALIIAAAALPAAAEAQASQRAACSVQQGDALASKGRSLTFVQCSQEVAAWGASKGLASAQGRWGSTALKVDSQGTVFTLSGRRWVAQGSVPDSDRDGLRYDACPTQAETKNNVFDTDGCPDTIDDLISLAKQDIENHWRALFRENGLTYRPPRTTKPYRGSRRPIRTGCGPSVPGNAFYCPNDNSIYYDLDLLETILATGEFGDFGAVSVLAHEWGHQVQAQLAADNVPSAPIGVELQADCFAGAYGRYVADGKSALLRLDEGDLEEGAQLLYALGDDLPWFDPQAHGSPKQRMSAYADGIQDFSRCLP